MSHHAPQPLPLLVQLILQLGDDLKLDPDLSGRFVVQSVLGIEMLTEFDRIVYDGVASWPVAVSAAEELVRGSGGG